MTKTNIFQVVGKVARNLKGDDKCPFSGPLKGEEESARLFKIIHPFPGAIAEKLHACGPGRLSYCLYNRHVVAPKIEIGEAIGSNTSGKTTAQIKAVLKVIQPTVGAVAI
ncbi:MAG: hypothetical protein AABY86_14950, partial [Bdellovibrionota bacterium]